MSLAEWELKLYNDAQPGALPDPRKRCSRAPRVRR